MKIENGVLYVDKALENVDASEFMSVIYQEDIREIVIQNSELSSAILQLLMCVAANKKVVSHERYLQLLFENVRYR